MYFLNSLFLCLLLNLLFREDVWSAPLWLCCAAGTELEFHPGTNGSIEDREAGCRNWCWGALCISLSFYCRRLPDSPQPQSPPPGNLWGKSVTS